MAQQVCVVLSAAEREQLTAIAADRNRPHKHIERAQIVLASADRHPAQRVAQSTGVSRPTVWRWQQRFAESGVDGLLRDKTRKPGKAPIASETAARVVAMACTEPPHEATHWTGRAMAKAIGISLGSVQRIWQAHKLQPHRLRTFKRSRDPSFADKLTDVVGLYVAPPAHAAVLSIDEKSVKSLLGTLFAFVVALIGLGLSFWAAMSGHAEFGAILGVGTLASLVGTFIYGTNIKHSTIKEKQHEDD
jgi:transposase